MNSRVKRIKDTSGDERQVHLFVQNAKQEGIVYGQLDGVFVQRCKPCERSKVLAQLGWVFRQNRLL